MKRLTWWFRVVGAFYLLLAAMNLYFVLLNPSAMTMMGSMPFAITADTTMAFVDGWSAFAFEILAIATFMLWASRNPRRYLGAAWLLVWLELLHGVVGDLYLIVRGYDTVSYVVFIMVHLIIIVTGVLSARGAEVETVRSAAAP